MSMPKGFVQKQCVFNVKMKINDTIMTSKVEFYVPNVFHAGVFM